MKVFKYLFLTLLIGVCSNVSSFAQQGKELTEEQKAELKEQLQAYNKELNLSEAQKPKFEKITRKYFEGLTSLKSSTSSRRTKYKKYKSLKKERKKSMKSLLSKDQYKVYKKRQKEMEKKMKEKIKEKKG